MTAYTAKASGNASSGGQTTWNEVGVPGDGDTISVGAFTVTFDVNVTIGTSPNDNTTKVIDKTSSTGALVIAPGVTLTVKGNIGGVNGSTFSMGAGSSLVLDASASGGTPVYRFINVGFQIFSFVGTSGSRCSISAVSGRTCSLNVPCSAMTFQFVDFTRVSAFVTTNSTTGNIIVEDCSFNTCAKLQLTSSSTSNNIKINRNVFTSGTDASYDFHIDASGATNTGIREITYNAFTNGVFQASGKFFKWIGNLISGRAGWVTLNATTNRWVEFRDNLVIGDGSANGGNGAIFPSNSARNYFVIENGIGNPHFVAAYAMDSGLDNTISQSIFESQTPDLIDTGDCVILNATCCNGSKIVVKNCIVLPTGYSGATVHTGQLITVYSSSTANNTSSQVQALHNTCNQNQTSLGGIGKRAAIAFAEASSGFADQVSAIKGNLVWAATANDGYLAERISGTVDGIITATGADYNWLWNIAAGDNGRGYEDRANSPGQDLWSSGNADGNDAAAAGVDNNQGSGNPQFVDSARNIAKWATARGYGSTYADGVAAVKADRTRIRDLIAYVFEGFKIQNASTKAAAHDGMPVGAANYEPGRTRTQLTSKTTELQTIFAV